MEFPVLNLYQVDIDVAALTRASVTDEHLPLLASNDAPRLTHLYLQLKTASEIEPICCVNLVELTLNTSDISIAYLRQLLHPLIRLQRLTISVQYLRCTENEEPVYLPELLALNLTAWHLEPGAQEWLSGFTTLTELAICGQNAKELVLALPNLTHMQMDSNNEPTTHLLPLRLESVHLTMDTCDAALYMQHWTHLTRAKLNLCIDNDVVSLWKALSQLPLLSELSVSSRSWDFQEELCPLPQITRFRMRSGLNYNTSHQLTRMFNSLPNLRQCAAVVMGEHENITFWEIVGQRPQLEEVMNTFQKGCYIDAEMADLLERNLPLQLTRLWLPNVGVQDKTHFQRLCNHLSRLTRLKYLKCPLYLENPQESLPIFLEALSGLPELEQWSMEAYQMDSMIQKVIEKQGWWHLGRSGMHGLNNRNLILQRISLELYLQRPITQSTGEFLPITSLEFPKPLPTAWRLKDF